MCFILRIVQPLKNVESKASGPKEPLCTKVLFNIYKDVSVNFPQASGPRTQVCLKFCLSTLQRSHSINFPQTSCSRTQACLRFCLNTLQRSHSVNLPQACLRFCLSTLQRSHSVNFPQASGPRTQACLRFCLSTLQRCQNQPHFGSPLICSTINIYPSRQRVLCSETVPTDFPSMCCASVILFDEGSTISTTRSVRTWPLTVRGIYLTLKTPNIVPHGAILCVAYATAKTVSSAND